MLTALCASFVASIRVLLFLLAVVVVARSVDAIVIMFVSIVASQEFLFRKG